jgi:hypothetical protein
MAMWLIAGNFLWYLFEWALALGVGAVAASLKIALALILAVGIGFTLLINTIQNKTKLMR